MKKTTYIVRRRYLKREKQRKLFRLGGVILITIFLITLLLAVIPSDASEDSGRIKYYASIEIAEGDTLTSIADKYRTDEYADRAAYIRELCSLNHLMTDSTIHSGQYLIVPYFADVQL